MLIGCLAASSEALAHEVARKKITGLEMNDTQGGRLDRNTCKLTRSDREEKGGGYSTLISTQSPSIESWVEEHAWGYRLV